LAIHPLDIAALNFRDVPLTIPVEFYFVYRAVVDILYLLGYLLLQLLHGVVDISHHESLRFPFLLLTTTQGLMGIPIRDLT
jgi:hypothetical protein